MSAHIHVYIIARAPVCTNSDARKASALSQHAAGTMRAFQRATTTCSRPQIAQHAPTTHDSGASQFMRSSSSSGGLIPGLLLMNWRRCSCARPKYASTTCVYVFTHACMQGRMYVRTHACTHACVCICVYVRARPQSTRRAPRASRLTQQADIELRT